MCLFVVIYDKIISMKEDDVILDPFELSILHVMFRLTELGTLTPEKVDEIITLLYDIKTEHFQLERKNDFLQEYISIDRKTGLLAYNDRYLTEILNVVSRTLQKVDSGEYSVSFARFDIDDFSLLNRKYGHAMGDKILSLISGAIKKNIRPTDYAVRFGGEVLDIIFPSTRIDEAEKITENILADIRNIKISALKQKLDITVSGGLTSRAFLLDQLRIINDMETHDLYHEFQRETAKALYEAKVSGKNQYHIYDPKRADDYEKYYKMYVKKV
jgi:diguanylate cyclase (GGDEF)-like protein